MPFCPKCRYEYIEGIWECPDCGVRLVDSLDEEESTEIIEEESPENVDEESTQSPAVESNQSIKAPLTKSLNFVPLNDIPSYIPAEILRKALDQAWIPSVLRGSTIWVPQEDLEKSKEIADQAFDNI